MRRTTAGRRLLLGGMAVAAFLAVGATAAWAAKPERAPYSPDPIQLETGQACAFPVQIEPVSGSTFTATTFGDGRFVITGSGHDRVTNLVTSATHTVPTSGKLTITELPDGDQRIQGSGRSIFYLFEGDQGPFGEVGFPGALYYVVGNVDETLDLDTNVITSFGWSGRATELCGLVD
jgi:hypothetical protein